MPLGRSLAPALGVAVMLLAVACRDAGGPVPPLQPFPKPATQVTSLPATVTASTFQDPCCPPTNTLDNDITTRWAALGDGQWIQYDLGALEAVGRVDIAWYQALPDTWESEFEIAVSPDAVNWTTVVSRRRSTAGYVEAQGYGFPSVTCRYVRIIGHGQWDGASLSTWWNAITEVDIYNVLPVVSVVASGSQVGFGPENTLDNNLSSESRWSSEGDGQWIQYDLGSQKAIGGVDIAWYQTPGGFSWESVFDVDVSSDAASWTRVFSGRSIAGNVQYQRYEFATVTCRYVRIIGHGQVGNPSSDWNSITEVDIHPGSGAGTCATGGPPQPPPPGSPNIIVQDGFENGLGQWLQDTPNGPRYNSSTAAAKSGLRSLEAVYAPGLTYGWIHKPFNGVDEIYVKFHVLFETGFKNPKGMHFLVMAGDSGNSDNGTAFGQSGRKADGTNFFYAGLDPEAAADPGPFKFYTYHMDMPCPPDYIHGISRNCFGDDSTQTAPKIDVVPNIWQEVVFHIRMNTPGQSNGSQSVWINGEKKIDWQNMRWRSTEQLRLNRIRFDNFMSDDAQPPSAQRVWVDDVTVWRP